MDAKSGDVQTKLNGYLTNGHKARSSVNIVDFSKSSGPSSDEVDVLIRNGRNVPNLTLDENSFQLEVHPTALSTSDFFEPSAAKIKSSYYPEVAELVKRATGAEHVIVFHHQVRSEAKINGTMNRISSVQGYAGGIHSDSSPPSADDLFNSMVGTLDGKLAEKYKTGRYLYINAWRNITDEPIQQNPLAVLDETSLIKPDDYVMGDLIGPGYEIQQYRLDGKNKDKHRWYYFSKQTKDEVLLFKQYDSDPSLSGRVCFHTAFKIPNAPANAPVRESIEARAIAFFPDHEPNTCPVVATRSIGSEGSVEACGQKILKAFDTIAYWPKAALLAVRWASAEGIVSGMLKDSENHFGLKDKSAEFKQQVKDYLFENDVEMVIAKAKTTIARLHGSIFSQAKWPLVWLTVGAFIGFGVTKLLKKDV